MSVSDWLRMVGPVGMTWALGHATGFGNSTDIVMVAFCLVMTCLILMVERVGGRWAWFTSGGKPVSVGSLEKWASRHPRLTWLGYGHHWGGQAARKLHEYLIRRPLEEGPLDLRRFIKHSRRLAPGITLGNMLVMGAPGTGKTLMFTWLAHQAIARGHGVVFIDPKGGRRVRSALKKSARKCGRPYFQLLPAEPQDSHCIDLLANAQQGSELASRIARLLPADEKDNAFGQFAWMVLNRIITALRCVGIPVTLRTVRWHVMDQGKALVEQMEHGSGHETLYRELQELAKHDALHYRKMILTLIPLLDTLTAGALGDLLSPVRSGSFRVNPAQVVAQGGVLYAGLGSLSDISVSRALGSLLLADLAAIAGNRYRSTRHEPALRVFVDEAAEMVNDAFIQLLNKGRECGVEVTFAVQTVADLELAMGNEAAARMMVGNAASLVAFRTLDPGSQQLFSERMGPVQVQMESHQSGAQNLVSGKGTHWGKTAGVSQQWVEVPLMPEPVLARLPDRHYVALLGGHSVLAGMLPPLVFS